MSHLVRALRREERGFAMITAVTLLAVLGTLVALILSVGSHTDFATGRGRNWVQALHVAESGVEQAIAKLQSTDGSYAGAFTGSVSEGSYNVTVTHLARKRFQIDAVATVGVGAGLVAERKLRVIMAPPPSFKYALFSYTSIDTKNNDTIEGDIWANQNVLVEQGDVVKGSVTAATGYIRMKNGSRIEGDAWSGGFDPSTTYAVHIGGNARVQGGVKASVTAPTDPVTCGGESTSNYTIRMENGATVDGSATTWGTKTGPGTVAGPVNNNVCTAAPASKPMPTFTYSELNYDAATLRQYGTPSTPSSTAVNDFHAYLDSQGDRIRGTFYISQAGTVSQDTRIDLTGVTIEGDTTIITNTPIYANGVTDDTTDAIVALVSTYQPPAGSACEVNNDHGDCTMHLKNNFQTTGKTAVLIYAPYGPVAVKNNQKQYGAIYADNILVKNNQEMVYDSRVERVVGFGEETYVVQQWLEMKV